MCLVNILNGEKGKTFVKRASILFAIFLVKISEKNAKPNTTNYSKAHYSC